jgi:hypothetical protein
MVKDFYQAGEDAWLVGLSYDFSHVGMDGLSSFFNYANGNTSAASPDEEEFDITVDYRFKKGIDVKDFRAIVNYELNIL